MFAFPKDSVAAGVDSPIKRHTGSKVTRDKFCVYEQIKMFSTLEVSSYPWFTRILLDEQEA